MGQTVVTEQGHSREGTGLPWVLWQKGWSLAVLWTRRTRKLQDPAPLVVGGAWKWRLMPPDWFPLAETELC